MKEKTNGMNLEQFNNLAAVQDTMKDLDDVRKKLVPAEQEVIRLKERKTLILQRIGELTQLHGLALFKPEEL